MARKRTVQEIIEDATAFISCQDLNDIQSRLGINKAALIFQGLHPQYYTFTVPKPKGGDRTIEAPQEDLKIIQRKLNTYLQAVYYTIQSPAAYGYIITPKNVKSTKNIVGNAEQHLGCTSMLNVDFKNFFHQISKQRVLHLFMNPPFSFKKKTASILARVTT